MVCPRLSVSPIVRVPDCPIVCVALCASTFLCATAFAQQTSTPPQASFHQSDEIPPLPLPTEAQLQRGHELLDKIAHVITRVPLTDAPAVLKVFGFTELTTVEYPTHVWVRPKGKKSKFAQPEELLGTGLSELSVQPWVDGLHAGIVASFSGTFVRAETCITMDDVRRVLEPLATTVTSERIRDIHPVQRPKPLHKTGHLVFTGVQTPFNQNAGASFRFEYQACAKSFGFAYHTILKETQK